MGSIQDLNTIQYSKSFRHFAQYLFLIGGVYFNRKNVEDDVYNHLQKMRKSIIKMELSYSDVDKLKEKIQNLISWERRYARFFKPEYNETQELKNQIMALELEVKNEKEEKEKVISENEEKIRHLSDSLDNIKNRMNNLLMERAKRQQRLMALEQKIRENVDLDSYYF